jgi:hypothetical protein
MKELISLISVFIYFLAGMVCLVMAYKCIFSSRYLPFHEEAAGRSWESIEKPLQDVIITILRISGMGFFIVFLLLTIFPVVNCFKKDPFIRFSIPAISIIFCFGLFLFNFQLYWKTKARTPWTGSLFAIIIILIGLILSVI